MAIGYLSRREIFAASHRLHCHDLTDDENQKLFGKCNHIHGHGHNYILEVIVKGEIDSKMGLVMNLADLKDIIAKHILDKIDHKHFNFDIPEFKEMNPTAENIVLIFWQWLSEPLGALLYEIKLHETENNIAFYRGE